MKAKCIASDGGRVSVHADADQRLKCSVQHAAVQAKPSQAKRVHLTVRHRRLGGSASCMRLRTPYATCVSAAARRFAADASYPKHAAGVSVSTVSPT